MKLYSTVSPRPHIFSRNYLFLMHLLTATLWLLESGNTSPNHGKHCTMLNRNVVRVEEALAEAYRVLKPGGRWDLGD